MIRLPNFEFHSPTALEEVFALLGTHGDAARLMSGGTDVLPKLKAGRMDCGHLIGLKRVAGLDRLAFDEAGGLTIGACTVLARVTENSTVRRLYPALAASIDVLATPQVRNKASLVGNLCNASPGADTATPLMAMGARVAVVSSGGRREVALEDFIQGPGSTALEPGELVEHINVPTPAPELRSVFLKFSPRSKVDIAAVNLAVALTLAEERIEKVDLFLGTVAPTPMRAQRTEEVLTGEALTTERIEEAALEASRECRPITDFRATETYKRRLVQVMTQRALKALSYKA